MSLKLVSVNVEGQKHLETVVEFLRKENPDVVCLMEVRAEDIEKLRGERYPHQIYAQNNLDVGVAIFSKQPIINSESYYCGEKQEAYLKTPGEGTHLPVLLLVKIGELQIGAVHFSWTREGLVDARQKGHLELLLKYLKEKGELVMCGDFNIPRGNEMYQALARNFEDNIPMGVETTIDPVLHYANRESPGRLKLVVDYVWTCLPAGRALPKYQVSNVRVISGVSDHSALVCTISLL